MYKAFMISYKYVCIENKKIIMYLILFFEIVIPCNEADMICNI